jgi:putative transposase
MKMKKYHVVFYQVAFIPKCRRKTLYGEFRQHLGEVFLRLATQKECRVEDSHLMPDHVHMKNSIPPKYAMSQLIGHIALSMWRGSMAIGSVTS